MYGNTQFHTFQLRPQQLRQLAAFDRIRSSDEIYGNIIIDNKNSYLGYCMDDKWRLTEDQLKKMLLVTNVVIGAPITEESKDEASTCFERQRATSCSQQHQTDQIPAQKPTNGDA